jgi:DNA-binding NtrC family response regulator
MLSGYKDPKFIVDSIKVGASDYLYKPSPYEELISVIERNLAKKKITDRNEALVEYYNEPIQNVQIIGTSHIMQDLLEKTKKLKTHDASVLIEGESGTGKEVLARHIHALEGNPKRPFIAVNCAAIPDALIESELFGHEKGSFTGAFKRKIGKFELANGGDLFLDEVNSLSPDFQAKLLRVLQEKEFFRVGGNESVKVSLRIIAATNRDLYQECLRGNFREDLLYRLRVIKFTIPPLRSRIEDVEPLTQHFVCKHSKDRIKKRISRDVIKKLQWHTWPGNIRELENVIQSVLIMSQNDEIQVSDLPDWIQNGTTNATEPNKAETFTYEKLNQSLKKFMCDQEQDYIRKVLEQNDGNLTKTAQSLKVSRTTLYKRMGREVTN